MTPSNDLLEHLLGIVEGVAAYGDHVDTLAGEQLAGAAREAVDRYWAEMHGYPDGARRHRDDIFTLLLNTQPHPVGH
jgi:hypothetical protein